LIGGLTSSLLLTLLLVPVIYLKADSSLQRWNDRWKRRRAKMG
jgi:Cu/Ag efflux pump CusA